MTRRKRKKASLTGFSFCPVETCEWQSADKDLHSAIDDLVRHLHHVHEQSDQTFEQREMEFMK